MITLFALSLPGLVIVVIALGVLQLARARVSGSRRPGSATAGIDLLDVVLKPGSEHRVLEQQSMKIKRDEDEKGAPPFSRARINDKSFSWKTPTKS